MKFVKNTIGNVLFVVILMYMKNNFISYKDIYDSSYMDDVFYDRELNEYWILNTHDNNGKIKSVTFQIVIRSKDKIEFGKELTVYNVTLRSRILLSLGINKIKPSIYWDKRIFLSKNCGKILKEMNTDEILVEYEKTLKDGFNDGFLTEEEYKTLLDF